MEILKAEYFGEEKRNDDLAVQSNVISFGEECQGCYRCIRECPVKAIRVDRGQAAVPLDVCRLRTLRGGMSVPGREAAP